MVLGACRQPNRHRHLPTVIGPWAPRFHRRHTDPPPRSSGWRLQQRFDLAQRGSKPLGFLASAALRVVRSTSTATSHHRCKGLDNLTGLHAPEVGMRLLFESDANRESQVPQSGAIGACWVLDVDSHDEAVGWARRCPGQPGDMIELRRIQEIEESPLDGSGA